MGVVAVAATPHVFRPRRTLTHCFRLHTRCRLVDLRGFVSIVLRGWWLACEVRSRFCFGLDHSVLIALGHAAEGSKDASTCMGSSLAATASATDCQESFPGRIEVRPVKDSISVARVGVEESCHLYWAVVCTSDEVHVTAINTVHACIATWRDTKTCFAPCCFVFARIVSNTCV